MKKLLPCPFCGGKADIYHTEHFNFHSRRHQFRCNQCNCHFSFYVKGEYKNAKQIEKEAVELWNTRTQNDFKE